MNRLKKIGVLLLSICLLVPIFSNEAWAASGSVKVSSASGTVGSTVTITCTASISGASMGGADIVLVYDASKLTLISCSSGASGSSGGVYYSQSATSAGQKSLSFSVTFKIEKEGSHSVSVTSAEIYDWDDAQSVATNKSDGTITGKVPETNDNDPDDNNNNNGGGNNNNTTTPDNSKSSNNKLSSLKVYPGTLSPAFSAGTSQYTVEVDEDVTEVTISATAQHNKAKVSVSGGKNLQIGSNTAKVVVTAENGNVRSYKITIVRKEKEEPATEVTIDGKTYTINEALEEEDIPEGFAKENVVYDSKEYVGAVFEKGALNLLSLTDEEEKSAFYIYDSEKQQFYPFLQMQISEVRHIILLPMENDIEGLPAGEESEVTLQGITFSAWKEAEGNTYILHVMNDEGTAGFYRYDTVDLTWQRYLEVVHVEENEDTDETDVQPEATENFLQKYDMHIIAGLAALVVLLLVIVICLLVKRKPSNHARRKKYRKRKKKELKKNKTLDE